LFVSTNPEFQDKYINKCELRFNETHWYNYFKSSIWRWLSKSILEENMSNILVITFEDEDQALSVLRSLKSLANQDMLSLDDAAVITKDAQGKVQVKNMTEKNVKTGAVVGGVIGLALGSLLFPVAGLALGAAGGALVGKTLDNGVDKQFVKEVTEALTPGSSAILFLVSHENTGMLITALEPYSGKIYQTSFDSEVEEELRKALK
jgi:uncharacterized membrane protein